MHGSTGFSPNLWYGSELPQRHCNIPVGAIGCSIPGRVHYSGRHVQRNRRWTVLWRLHLMNPEGLDEDDADRLNRYISFQANSDAIREAIASLSKERREQ